MHILSFLNLFFVFITSVFATTTVPSGQLRALTRKATMMAESVFKDMNSSGAKPSKAPKNSNNTYTSLTQLGLNVGDQFQEAVIRLLVDNESDFDKYLELENKFKSDMEYIILKLKKTVDLVSSTFKKKYVDDGKLDDFIKRLRALVVLDKTFGEQFGALFATDKDLEMWLLKYTYKLGLHPDFFGGLVQGRSLPAFQINTKTQS